MPNTPVTVSCTQDHVFIPLSRSSLGLGQRSEAEVRLDDAELREQGLGLLVLDTGVNNDIITGDPGVELIHIL